MQIYVNGVEREVDDEATVATLLEDLGLEPARVAVERNREIVRRTEFAAAGLFAGDRFEIVTLVGGG